MTEVKVQSNGGTQRPETIRQNVVERMVIYNIHLGANSDQRGYRVLPTPARAIKSCPIDLVSGRHENLRNLTGNRIARPRRCPQAKCTQGGPGEERNAAKMPIRKLGTRSEGLGEHIRWQQELISRRNYALLDECKNHLAQLLLRGRRQKVRLQYRLPGAHTVVSANGEPGFQVHTRLRVEPRLIQTKRRTIQIDKSSVGIVFAQLCLLRCKASACD